MAHDQRPKGLGYIMLLLLFLTGAFLYATSGPKGLVWILAILAGIIFLYFAVYALAKAGMFFTFWPMKNTFKGIKKGDDRISRILNGNKPPLWNFWYWLCGAYWIGVPPAHKVLKIHIEKDSIVGFVDDTDEDVADVEVETQVGEPTDQIPYAFDASLKARKIETAGTYQVFFTLNGRYAISENEESEYLSYLLTNSSPLKKAWSKIYRVINAYARHREIEQISEDHRDGRTLEELILDSKEDIKKLSILTIIDIDLVDWGPEPDDPERLKALAQKETNELLGEAEKTKAQKAGEALIITAELEGQALVKSAKYKKDAAEMEKDAGVILNQVEADLLDKLESEETYVAKKKWEALKNVETYVESSSENVVKNIPITK